MNKRRKFLADQENHLKNKAAAIESRLLNKHMPEEHRQHKLELLKKIAEALLKIKEGTYGFCHECGKKIPTKRLELRPEADLCVNCQERREHDEQIRNTKVHLIDLAA